MAIAELVRQYLATLLSWPTVGLILGGILLYTVRKDLGDLLRRLGKVQGYGLTLEAARPIEQEQEQRTEPPARDANAIVEQVRQHPQQAVVALGRLLNGYRWEKALNVIFGSQMDLLKHLEERGDQGEKYVNLLPFFQSFLSRGGHAGTQLADYLSFLVTQGFIEYAAPDSEQVARITPHGIDFMSYLRAEYPHGTPFRAF